MNIVNRLLDVGNIIMLLMDSIVSGKSFVWVVFVCFVWCLVLLLGMVEVCGVNELSLGSCVIVRVFWCCGFIWVLCLVMKMIVMIVISSMVFCRNRVV